MPRGLKLIFLEDSHARVHGGLSLAVAAAAMDRPTALFFQGVAVRALAASRCWAADPPLRESGIATISDLLAQARELGIGITACESGMHMAGVRAEELRGGVETGGLIGFLAGSADAELVVV